VAFKNKKKPKERIELVSLIDMVFILLVFFLVTSFAIRLPLQERSLSIPTPENSLGRAQTVIQFIDDDRVFWLDEDATSMVEEIEDSLGYLSRDRLRNRIVTELIRRNTISLARLDEELERLRMRAEQDTFARYFVLVRCPDEVPYFRVLDVMTKVSNTRYSNIKYGLVGGTLDEIRECQRIHTVLEVDARGRRRKNIRIDF
jgi:biopolymer transport protein ExbD